MVHQPAASVTRGIDRGALGVAAAVSGGSGVALRESSRSSPFRSRSPSREPRSDVGITTSRRRGVYVRRAPGAAVAHPSRLRKEGGPCRRVAVLTRARASFRGGAIADSPPCARNVCRAYVSPPVLRDLTRPPSSLATPYTLLLPIRRRERARASRREYARRR